MNHTNPAYLFGDTDLAAERLRRLADVFAPSTREFLQQLQLRMRARIADLGCGPGYTTRLLAEVFSDATVRGLDSSQSFIARAGQASHERVAFEVADVTHDLPGGPYDLVYARYLLTHVANFRETIEFWSRHLTRGGAIAIEENEWIRAHQPAFEKYLAIVERMLAAGGQKLYVGAELDAVERWPSLVKRSSEVVPIPVSAHATAGMFLPNLQTWRGQTFIERNYEAGEIDALERDLRALAAGRDGPASITFGRRRLVLAGL